MSTRYQLGTAYQIAGTFAASGVGVDPTTVRLYVVNPNRVQQTLVYGTDEEIERDEAGVYSYVWEPDVAGQWVFRWDGEGGITIETRDKVVIVETSRIPQRV